MRPSVALISSLLLTCGVDAKPRPSSRAFLVRPTVRSIPRGGEYSYGTSSGYPEEEDPYLSNRPSDDYYGDGGMYQDERDYQEYDRGMVSAKQKSCFSQVLLLATTMDCWGERILSDHLLFFAHFEGSKKKFEWRQRPIGSSANDQDGES
jgi:hypothetical protein